LPRVKRLGGSIISQANFGRFQGMKCGQCLDDRFPTVGIVRIRISISEPVGGCITIMRPDLRRMRGKIDEGERCKETYHANLSSLDSISGILTSVKIRPSKYSII
jgi:hypothetical protein